VKKLTKKMFNWDKDTARKIPSNKKTTIIPSELSDFIPVIGTIGAVSEIMGMLNLMGICDCGAKDSANVRCVCGGMKDEHKGRNC